MFMHHLFQRLRSPVLVKVDLETLSVLRFAQHASNLRKDGPGVGLGLRIVEIAAPANIAYQDIHPPTEEQPEEESERECEYGCRNSRESEDVIACGRLPAVDEAQVVNDQRADRGIRRIVENKRRNLDRPVSQLQQAASPLACLVEDVASDLLGRAFGLVKERVVVAAKYDGHQAFICRNAGQVGAQPPLVVAFEKARQ